MVRYLAKSFVWLISRMPFALLYLFSDICYLFVYKLARYRVKVVRENLNFSFPEKTDKELLQIERKFYRHFCDLIFESLKLAGMSREEIGKRMQYINHEALLKHYEEGRSVMLHTSHYGNWEWTSSFSLLLPEDKPVFQVYKKQKNDISNEIIDSLRTRFGAKNVEMKSLLREMVRHRQEGQLGMYGMLSDQSPGRSGMKFFTRFLNQHTAVIVGTEQLARKFNYPIYYVRLTKLKRGYYTCELMPLELQPKATQEFEISEKYMRLLEEDIMNEPANWLWTHKRWKHTR